jgi:23S rRNA pseudouridine1911/1915/1917 synthase
MILSLTVESITISTMNMDNSYNIAISSEEEGSRIDSFLAGALEEDLSRSYIQKLIRQENISVNGHTVKPNHRLKANDEVVVSIPEPEKIDLMPKDIPLEILYEDSSIAVINKQPGIAVHPGAGTEGDTLVNALLFHLKDLSSIGGVERPGIVHRLDKDTSGLMVIAKNDRAHRNLSDQFSSRSVKKEYIAIVTGKPKDEHCVIEKPIGRHNVFRQKMTVTENGREAKTEIFCVKNWTVKDGTFSRLRVIIHTGRTHQIRVHLASESIPVVGDQVYSRRGGMHDLPYMLLASVRLSFMHPETGKILDFIIDPPPHIQQFIDKLDSQE